MNTDELRRMLSGFGICEKLDDFENHGLPDLVLFSGGHAIFVFVECTERQEDFIKRIAWQLAPHFIWILTEQGLDRSDLIVKEVPISTSEEIREWLDNIEEENQNFDYLAKYAYRD